MVDLPPRVHSMDGRPPGCAMLTDARLGRESQSAYRCGRVREFGVGGWAHLPGTGEQTRLVDPIGLLERTQELDNIHNLLIAKPFYCRHISERPMMCAHPLAHRLFHGGIR